MPFAFIIALSICPRKKNEIKFHTFSLYTYNNGMYNDAYACFTFVWGRDRYSSLNLALFSLLNRRFCSGYPPVYAPYFIYGCVKWYLPRRIVALPY